MPIATLHAIPPPPFPISFHVRRLCMRHHRSLPTSFIPSTASGACPVSTDCCTFPLLHSPYLINNYKKQTCPSASHPMAPMAMPNFRIAVGIPFPPMGRPRSEWHVKTNMAVYPDTRPRSRARSLSSLSLSSLSLVPQTTAFFVCSARARGISTRRSCTLRSLSDHCPTGGRTSQFALVGPFPRGR